MRQNASHAMKLAHFNAKLSGDNLDDCEVVGLNRHGYVFCYRKEDGTVYSTGLHIDDFTAGADGWNLTRAEAARVGIRNYAQYQTNRKQALAHFITGQPAPAADPAGTGLRL